MERQKRQEKAALPQKKRRRLELKQERLTQKGAREAAEGDTYQSEVGMTPNIDTESVPEAVPKPGFTKVENLSTLQVSYVVIDLETTGLIQRGLIPHITQIAAQDMASGEKFSCYIKPLIPISVEAQKVTGISWNGTAMTVKGLHVDAFPIEEALCKFLEFLKKFDSVILVAHNGRVFDFRVLSYAVNRLGICDIFLNYVLAFVDSLSMFRSKVPKLSSYKQEYLAQHFCEESYNAHNATDDVNMLIKILYKSDMTKSDFVKHSYSANCHFLQEVFNETKSRNIDSLHCLIASGVLKTATAENIAGSGLNLHHLQLIWQRDGEDGLLNVLSAKNSLDKPRVTKDKRLLGNIIPKLCCYFQE